VKRLLGAAVIAACAIVAFILRDGPRFALPAPTGRYAVGTTTITLPQEGASARGRFRLTVWYPAQPSSNRAAYGAPDAGFPRRVASLLIASHAALDARVADDADSIPAVMYVASWGGSRSANTALAEDLASHGYAVIALDDPNHDDRPHPESHLEGLDLSSDAAYARTLAVAPRKRAFEARRLSYVLDQLSGATSPLEARLRQRIDFHRVGSLGYSFGGSVAVEACRRDPRFQAAMNLDGWLFEENEPAAERLHCPYLFISSDDPPPTMEDLQAADPVRRLTARLNLLDQTWQQKVLERGGLSIVVARTSHDSFIDDVRYAILKRPQNGRNNPDRIASLVGRYGVAFFDATLRGRHSALLETPVDVRDEYTVRVWPFSPGATRRVHARSIVAEGTLSDARTVY
jgi:dienelactone hydrolase